MGEANEKKGFWQVITGPDTIAKAGYYRMAGIVCTIAFGFLTLGSALLLDDVSLWIFIGLGLGAFFTVVSSTIRRRVAIDTAIQALRAEVEDLKRRIRETD